MANPEIESPLDGIDKLTVSLYRLGLSAAALLLLCRGAALLSGMALLPSAQWLMSLAVASAICGFSLHIYDKRIRLILQGFGWGALALAAVGAPDALVLGAALATLSISRLMMARAVSASLPVRPVVVFVQFAPPSVVL